MNLFNAALVAIFLLTGCSTFQKGMEPLPKRDETFSYFGPGSERVLKGGVPAISFAEDSSRFDAGAGENGAALDAVLDRLAEDLRRQVLLAGFANDSGTAEFNRVLGEERSQAVRVALLGKGVASARIHTVSYGNELDARQGAAGRRVEVGIVEPDPLEP
jgi:outer membrane protein OmpA-like peptidoglycan-associated protein